MGTSARRARLGGGGLPRGASPAAPVLILVGISDQSPGTTFLIFDRPITFDTEASTVDGTFFVAGEQPAYIIPTQISLPPNWIQVGFDTLVPVAGTPFELVGSPTWINEGATFPAAGQCQQVPLVILGAQSFGDNNVGLIFSGPVVDPVGAIAPSTVLVDGIAPTAISNNSGWTLELFVVQTNPSGLPLTVTGQPSWMVESLATPASGSIG